MGLDERSFRVFELITSESLVNQRSLKPEHTVSIVICDGSTEKPTRNVHADTSEYRSCNAKDPIAHCIKPVNDPESNLNRASTKSLAS